MIVVSYCLPSSEVLSCRERQSLMHYTDGSVSDWQSLRVSISDIRYDRAAVDALGRIKQSI